MVLDLDVVPLGFQARLFLNEVTNAVVGLGVLRELVPEPSDFALQPDLFLLGVPDPLL